MATKNSDMQVKNHIGSIIVVKKTKRKTLINRFIETNIVNIFVNVIFFCQFYLIERKTPSLLSKGM